MANEYRTSEGVFNNTPLEDIFHPRGSITKRADVGIRVGGSDISNLYAPIASGSATTATGFRAGGADLNTLFAGIGTVSTLGITGNTALDAVYGGWFGATNPILSMTLGFTRAGAWNFAAGVTWGQAGKFESGTWISGGGGTIGDAYEIQYTSGPLFTPAPSTTWYTLNTTRNFSASFGSTGFFDQIVIFTIREIANPGTSILAQFTVMIEHTP